MIHIYVREMCNTQNILNNFTIYVRIINSERGCLKKRLKLFDKGIWLNICRWEVVGSESGIQYSPFPVPMQGLPAKFWKESSN